MGKGRAMGGEDAYRMMVLAVFVFLVPIALYYRLKSFTGERLSRRDEGLLILVGLRLAGLAVMVGALAFVINPVGMKWAAVKLPDWSRWIGLPLGLAAVAWSFWMLRTLGPNLTDTVNVRAKATLVTGGPYRWVRHPMYLGVAFLMLAISLITANAFVALAGSAVEALLLLRTRTEEAKLVQRFGDAYREYARRTGRFVPRF
jgi:protein-S-isoprenylcysteine O-methyltransferase Ste14